MLRTHKRSFSIFLWEVISLDRQSPFVGDGIIFRELMKRSLRRMANLVVTAHNTATRHGENSSILLLEEKVENVERCQNFDFLHFVSMTSSPGQAWGFPYLVIFEIEISQKRLLGCTSDQDHSNQRPKHYKVWKFDFWANFPFKYVRTWTTLPVVCLKFFFCTDSDSAYRLLLQREALLGPCPMHIVTIAKEENGRYRSPTVSRPYRAIAVRT